MVKGQTPSAKLIKSWQEIFISKAYKALTCTLNLRLFYKVAMLIMTIIASKMLSMRLGRQLMLFIVPNSYPVMKPSWY